MAQTNKSIMVTPEQYAVITELRDKLRKDMSVNVSLGEAVVIAAKEALKQSPTDRVNQ